jgi:hypothetical protein
MRPIAVSAAVSVALIALYLALGGTSYAPVKVADPCVPREWRDPGSFQLVAEQIVLSALDGAACELGVSRERVVLAFDSRESLARFARAQGIGTDRLEELTRAGVLRAIRDAERSGALAPAAADELRGFVRRFSIAQLFDVLDVLRRTS